MAAEVKEKFGGRKELIEEYLKLASRLNVRISKERLSGLTVGKLLDLYHQARRRSTRAERTKSNP